jgi:hydroxylamine dehydrogenase
MLIVLFCALIVIILFAALARSVAVATPDYALKTGQPCAYCHERIEGGGTLTAKGAAFLRGGYAWPIPDNVNAAPSTARFPGPLRLIIGFIHVVTAVLWFGTIFYIQLIVRPQTLTSGIPRTEVKIGWISIVTMAVTGTLLTYNRYLETGTVFSGTWGTVFIIKLAQYGLLVLGAAIATGVLDRRMRAARRSAKAGMLPSDAITAQNLAAFDGREGHKGIVAVAGKLYDVTASKLWREGSHVRKHQAGQELTDAIKAAPHGLEVLERVPGLGTLQAGSTAPQPAKTGPSAHRVFVFMAYFNLLLVAGILLCVSWWKWGFSLQTTPPAPTGPTAISKESQQCIACHSTNEFMQSQIAEWKQGKMAAANVGCYECHRAIPADRDAMAHNGFTIAVIVSPNDCGRCHVAEAKQFASSRHSQGGEILASLDNVLGEKVEGAAAAVAGCKQCHGSVVELDSKGVPLATSWPNTGIGRINPDGSRGSCSTCHTRHLFSVAVAREPASCGNCHMGPDHPQKEIYEESKHGVAFLANHDRMALADRPWVLGEDYSAAPTCATCHMSALPGVAVNHDVGKRISWTLRPAISVKLEDAETRRNSMRQVCAQCHSPGFHQNFFEQFDAAVELYNTKFAAPAGEIMQRLRAAGKLTKFEFDEKIEWTYYLLWHHEGRRARHGAAMMGPDYVQWHGFFEVADRFYNEFVPEAEELLPGVTDSFLADPLHQWMVPK